MLGSKIYDEVYRQTLSDYFSNLRAESGKTFEEVANAIGIKPNTFYCYEKGMRDMPISVFINLCKYYGLDYTVVFPHINDIASQRVARRLDEKI